MNKKDVSILEIDESHPRFTEAEEGPVRIPKTGIVICKDGDVKLSIDEKKYVLSRNSMIVYFANSELHIEEHSQHVRALLIGADLEALQPVLYNVTNFNAIFVLMQSPLQHISDEELGVIEQYIALLAVAIRKDEEQKNTMAVNKPVAEMAARQVSMISSSLVMEILQCYTCTSECSEPMSRREDILKNFLTLLYKHYRKEHKINYYADLLFLTPRYFSLVIKEQSGQSPLSWITTALYVDARNLLRDTNMSVKEIADTLHFPTQSYFGKWFKNITGLNPLEYRHRNGETANAENELTSYIDKHINRQEGRWDR